MSNFFKYMILCSLIGFLSSALGLHLLVAIGVGLPIAMVALKYADVVVW